MAETLHPGTHGHGVEKKQVSENILYSSAEQTRTTQIHAPHKPGKSQLYRLYKSNESTLSALSCIGETVKTPLPAKFFPARANLLPRLALISQFEQKEKLITT